MKKIRAKPDRSHNKPIIQTFKIPSAMQKNWPEVGFMFDTDGNFIKFTEISRSKNSPQV